ncbi:hypothetical protein AL073_15485 [Loktanella sp. 1ANDIMAR09]|nr:hypothetical protein AL073_15485 [Loktanella sp. 1ANDIMAR09]
MKILLTSFFAWIALATLAASQHAHTDHADMGGKPNLVLSEPGQGAFAAIAEITQVLRDDPSTDWSKVNITALREHLIDMDLVATDASVTASPTPQGATFVVTGDGRTQRAIKTMVPAHAPFLAAETGWEVAVQEIDSGVAMHVSGDATQIVALGFIGLMTIGAHHQEHHLMMAQGGDVH